jgi:transposase
MATVQEKAMCVLWLWETKSPGTVKRRFQRQFNKDPPKEQSLRRWLKQFQETGSVLHRKGAGRPSVSADTEDNTEQAFTRSSTKSIL